MKTKLFIALIAFGLITFSCKKDDDAPTPTEQTNDDDNGGGNNGNTTGNAQPNFAGADASLWAIKSLSVTNAGGFPVTTTIGLGVGAFFDGSGNLVEVGTVKLNNETLTKNPNNSYVYQPGTQNPLGIDFSGGVSWNVTGGNGFTGFTKNVTLSFPTVDEINSSTTITKANGYTLSTTQVTGADSVIFLIGEVSKTLAGNATSCSFSANDLSGLSNGSTVIQIAAYTYDNDTQGGKTIYYGNETVQSKTATIQ